MQMPQRIEILLWNIVIPVMRGISAVRHTIENRLHVSRWSMKKLAVLLFTAAAITVLIGMRIPARFMAGVAPSAGQPVAPWVEKEQKNLLVIGVDRLNSSRPVLESAWLVLYYPGVAHYSFIPLFPAQGNPNPDLDQAIRQAFKLDKDHSPSAAFLNALRSAGAWWDHYIILDEMALAELIDLSANPTHAERVTGLELVAASLGKGDLGAPVASQAGLIATACRGMDLPALPEDLAGLMASYGDHLRTDMKPRQIFDALSWLAETHAENSPEGQSALVCEFPTIPTEITLAGGHLGNP
jgi:hypothetical protein